MVYLLYYKNSKFMVIKSDFFKSSRFLFLKNENEFEIFRIPPPLFENIIFIINCASIIYHLNDIIKIY